MLYAMCCQVYLHVQTSNTEAIDFYRSKGFENVGEVKDYYKHITPPDAFKLRLGIEPIRTMVAARKLKEEASNSK